jgi:hypothetical protein
MRVGFAQGGALGGGVGEQQIPHFVRSDNTGNDNTGAGPAFEELEARRTGVSAPHDCPT